MKKLIMAVAIVCAAVAANAAAIDWTCSKVVDPWASQTAGKTTPASGWLAYAILAGDLDTVTADLKDGSTTELVNSAVGAPKTLSKGAANAAAAAGNVAAGSQTFYMIVLDSGDVATAKNFYVSDAAVATIDASLDTLVAFGSQQTKSQDAANWTSMEAVPEPTSGLLMLLGMAGLALRRRRA